MGVGIAPLLGALGLTAGICFRGVHIGRKLGVLDHPDSARKLHRRATPQVGGLAVISGLVFWLVCASAVFPLDHAAVNAAILCGAGVALVGFSDDQNGVSPGTRLAFLFVFALLSIVLVPSVLVPQINSLVFGHVALPLMWYCGLLVLASVGIVNAVNMADGQDGIAAGMFAIWTACLAYTLTGTSQSIAATLFLLCLVFLVFNLKARGKVFLGDCGSYGITFVIGLLVMQAHARGEIPIETIVVWFFIPVLDCLRVLLMRLQRGLSPLRPDRDHFHHRLEDRFGKSWGLACYLGMVGISSMVSTLAPHWASVFLCILSGSYAALVIKHPAEMKDEVIRADLRHSNVVPILDSRNRDAA